MAAAQDRSGFLASNATRLQIAEWCEREAISREEIARRLNRPSGGVSAPTTMLRRQALVNAGYAGDRGGERGAELLRLSPGWKKALQEARRMRRPTALEPGTDLFLIPLGSTESACRALAQAKGDDIEWGMQLDGEQLGMLLGARRHPRGLSAIRTAATLEHAGVRPWRIRLKEPMTAEELRAWTAEVAGVDGPSLEPGDS